ncbi:MAG: carboxylating nicotinate-nucleotide diphosphorylase [Lysobacterales bacterium]
MTQTPPKPPPPHLIAQDVQRSLTEDLGLDGDITAALIKPETTGVGRVITRENCIISGQPWVDECFRQVDGQLAVRWHCQDGDDVAADQELFRVTGNARAILTAERSALNFLQMLSGVATETGRYAQGLKGTGTRVLDTRKTLPGLRTAQKYAVACGGGVNHRMGLYDAFLIKENHIAAAGSIAAAVDQARSNGRGELIEVEVENFTQLREALSAGAERIMLDNFNLEETQQAVDLVRSQPSSQAVELEASGGIELDRLSEIAATGVDFVSVGALTKHVRAVDLSMRFV